MINSLQTQHSFNASSTVRLMYFASQIQLHPKCSYEFLKSSFQQLILSWKYRHTLTDLCQLGGVSGPKYLRHQRVGLGTQS